MTRRDYEMVAASFKAAHDKMFTEAEEKAWRKVVDTFCEDAAQHGSNFKSAQFLRACGVEGV